MTSSHTDTTAGADLAHTAPAAPSAGRLAILLGLGGCWVAMALAETLLGDLDGMPDAATLTAESGRVVSAGLLHVVAGFLLAIGLQGVAAGVPGSRLLTAGRVGCSLLAASLGAFGMLHLLALEMGDEQLGALDAFGAWGVPVMVVAMLGMWLLALLLGGLARAGRAPRWTVVLVAAGAVLHFVEASQLTEALSHWIVAAGVAVAARSATRR